MKNTFLGKLFRNVDNRAILNNRRKIFEPLGLLIRLEYSIKNFEASLVKLGEIEELVGSKRDSIIVNRNVPERGIGVELGKRTVRWQNLVFSNSELLSLALAGIAIMA